MKYFFLFFLIIVMPINAQTKSTLITPPYLQKGDTIAILAPAGIIKAYKKPAIENAKRLAESWGLKVVFGSNLYNQNNHFAGTDEQRCQDFQDALDNPNIKAIWCGRGGYGSVRILDKLDFSKFLKQPKWIIGYSDITAFHSHLHTLGVETLHAMLGSSMQNKAEDIPHTIETFRKALFGEVLEYKIPSSKYNRNGKITGNLVGGNIAILSSMLGSQSQISTNQKILFIEEVGEYKYSIDRMLQSLKRAGYFKNVKAVVVGGMTKIRKNTTPWGTSIEQLISDVVPNNIPILFNFPAGHELDNRALLMGRTAEVTIADEFSTITFVP
ncbi:LD-carboxypeptidase [uncultured Maribacter sp.]|uniref:S66 peptidase family protein n=1 Tax=uncultured Maribacter sp. TaxID=431308 RepID=UPI00263A2BA4|nr:LD-carboxypeptidase [uncultured Maribacter sp.]